MKIYIKLLKFVNMKNNIQISDTAFSPIISIGTANETGFFETSAPRNNLSEFIKNESFIIEDDFYVVPIVETDSVTGYLPKIEVLEEK